MTLEAYGFFRGAILREEARHKARALRFEGGLRRFVSLTLRLSRVRIFPLALSSCPGSHDVFLMPTPNWICLRAGFIRRWGGWRRSGSIDFADFFSLANCIFCSVIARG